jgi:probable HAF family extracellular repeat protein
MILSTRIMLAAAALVSTSALAASHYRIVDTGIANLNPIQVQGMNDRGDLVGLVYNASFEPEAFVYDYSSRTVNSLPSAGAGLSFKGSQALEINNRGSIVGLTSVPGMNEWHGVRWDMNGGFDLLPGVHYSYGIDSRDRIVGQDDNDRAIMWVKGRIVDLGLSDIGIARSISETGFVTGVLQNSGHAFLYWRGESEDIGVLYPGSSSDGYRVNDFGEVVGSAGVRPVPNQYGGYNYPTHAFLYRRGEMKDLGALSDDPAISSYATSINDSREVVGASQIPPGPNGGPVQFSAFLYQHGRMHDLNTLIDPADPLAGQIQLTRATEINCRGWIAAEGTSRATGLNGAYLLIPNAPAKHPHVCIR